MRGSNDGMRSAKAGTLPLFLVMHCPLLPMDRPFLGMCWLLFPMRDRLLAMQRPFLPMLSAFAATRCEGEATGHEESPHHHAICPLSDPFRRRGSECVRVHRLLVAVSRSLLGILRPFVVMLHALAATRSEGEAAGHEESPGHHAIRRECDLFRGRGSKCFWNSSEGETTRHVYIGMPRERLEMSNEERTMRAVKAWG
jgi:hypothetical protein